MQNMTRYILLTCVSVTLLQDTYHQARTEGHSGKSRGSVKSGTTELLPSKLHRKMCTDYFFIFRAGPEAVIFSPQTRPKDSSFKIQIIAQNISKYNLKIMKVCNYMKALYLWHLKQHIELFSSKVKHVQYLLSINLFMLLLPIFNF